VSRIGSRLRSINQPLSPTIATRPPPKSASTNLSRHDKFGRFATSAALYFINRKVQALAGFTINDVDTVASARECWVPALIAHGK